MRLRLGFTTVDEKTFLISQMIVSTLIILFTMTQKYSMTSIMFAISFINVVLLYITSYRRCYLSSLGWVFLIWCAFSILSSYLTGEKAFVFADLVSYATLASTIFYMQVVNNVRVTKTIAHSVLYIGLASSALYPIGYYFLHANEYRSMGKTLLQMYFSSPNLTGLYLAQACLYSILCFFLTNKKFLKFLSVVIFAFDFYFLYLTGARNSQLTVVLALFGVILILLKIIKKIHPRFSLFIAISPLVFALLYLLIVDYLGTSGILGFLVEEGKNIDSREGIWKLVFSILEGIYWLIGDFAKLRGNLHNTHITVLGSYGIIGLWIYIKYLNETMNATNRLLYSSKQAICLVCFYGTIFMGFGEAALIYGSMGMYAIACSYLLLARYDWDLDLPIEDVLFAEEGEV